MIDLTSQKEISIRGKVVEVSIRDGKQIIKLATEPCYLEITVDTSLDVHLDDELSLNGNFIVEKIVQEIRYN